MNNQAHTIQPPYVPQVVDHPHRFARWLAGLGIALLTACTTTSGKLPTASPDSLAWILQQGVADDSKGAIRVIEMLEARGFRGIEMHRTGPARRLALEDAVLYDIFTGDDTLAFHVENPLCFPLKKALRIMNRTDLKPDPKGFLLVPTRFGVMRIRICPDAKECLSSVVFIPQ